ncbi:transposase [Labrys portucalensis]|uniref:Transposase n=1 Tax=Labrys neptuniae TaxID=376174 RepID=A0ABV6ZF43_9HYPH
MPDVDPEWHSRGYIPHWEAGETPQVICFRLADSLPVALVEQLLADISQWPENQAAIERRKRLETMLDGGRGAAYLVRPEIGTIVETALLFFDGTRYRLHAWCIMPNHVHVLLTPLHEHKLSSLVHSWKSFTAHRINQALNRTGPVWFKEYFDRKIRNEQRFEAARFYTEQNPVKARLCRSAEDWPFSSARHGLA